MKHGPSFGLSGAWNPSRGAEFSAAVNKHINLPNILEIQGQYKKQPAIFYVDPATALSVVSRPDGAYWTAFQLASQQLKDVLERGWLW